MKTKTVLAVILFMILGGGAILTFERTVRNWRGKENRELCGMIKHHQVMLRMYSAEYGRLPTSLTVLYTSKFNPHYRNDPWGRRFVYAYPAPIGKAARDGYTLYSLGPNGLDENGDGDDVIW